MSLEGPGDLHSQVDQEEKVMPTDSPCQEQYQIIASSVSCVAAKRNNKHANADLNEGKESSCENCVRAENKNTYGKGNQFSKAKITTKAELIEETGTFKKINNKTDVVGSTVNAQLLQRKSQHTNITRGHLLSEAGQSVTEGQALMGSALCAKPDCEDRNDKLQQETKKRKQGPSKDSNEAKRLSFHSGRHWSSSNGKKQTQLTQHRFETRATWKAQQKMSGQTRFNKDFVDKDTESYRNGYPGKKDNPHLNDNLRFYRGELMSVPKGAYIDVIHQTWWGDYELLERHHGYIQWLFPIREGGMNSKAQPLQQHEAEAIKADFQAKNRVLMSYKLMLDFYGMELKDDITGQLKRSKNWRKRYDNLKRSAHNYLRITRILKCLGELGYENLKKGLLEFVLEEALIHQTLDSTWTSYNRPDFRLNVDKL
ncbi:hypothetical protein BsWGS_19308 [Bradybaena similaris]